MDGERTNNRDERELLRRFSRGLGPATEPCPSELELAAYVDGLASETEQARIEAHLALCPHCLDEIVEARRLAVEAVADAPPIVVARAEALVPARRALRPSRRWLVAARWAAAAAAAAAVSFAGLQAGSAAARARGQTAARLADEVTFQPPEAYQALLGIPDVMGDLAAQAKEAHHE
jgi:anti-sigma factor RsiW